MLRSLDAVVDVMHVPASGDAGAAVRTVPALALARDQDCDILVVGGGTGGVAAALAAARAGRQVVLLEETDWLGGQQCAKRDLERPGATACAYVVGSGAMDVDGIPAHAHRVAEKRSARSRLVVG